MKRSRVVALVIVTAALLHAAYLVVSSRSLQQQQQVYIRVLEQTYNDHVLVTHFRSGQMSLARSFMGCVHRADPTQRVQIVFHNGSTQDEYDELKLFHNTVLVSSSESNGTTVVDLNRCLVKPLACGLTVSSEPDKDASCWLRYRVPETLPGQRPVFRLAKTKPLIAFFVATYVSRAIAIPEIPLLSVFLPAFIWSVQADLEKFRVRLVLGVQVDVLWDNHAEDLMQALHSQLDPVGIELDVVRYALNPRLRGTAFKYNMLARRAYDSGAVITCQFSDDAKILSQGWAPVFFQYISERDGFGTFGFRDTKNAGTMTLGCSGRKHHEINGWFWPAPSMTNWFADDFVQQVWGPKYSHRFDNLSFDNTQKEGQRYDECLSPGRDLLEYEWYAARMRAADWFEQREHDFEKAKYLRELAGPTKITNPLERPIACL